LQQTLKGSGRIVFITGVAGQGKTALLGEFTRRAVNTNTNLLVAMGNCSAFSGIGDPYLPFRDVLSMLTGDVESLWSSGNISREHAQRIWSALPTTIQALMKRGDLLIGTFLEGKDLFSRAVVSIPDNTHCLEQLRNLIEQGLSADINVEQTFLFENYINFLLTISEHYPLVIILDDLQWADSASISLLFHLGRRLAKAQTRIMVTCAYRPEEVALDRNDERHPFVKVLHEFKRIFGDDGINFDQTEEEGKRFIDALLDTEPNKLAQEFRETLYQHTQGHLLFTVELLRAMQEREDVFKDQDGDWVASPMLDWGLLPVRVQAVIEERIDRLTYEQQQILNTASVEGEVFTAQIIAGVQKATEKPLLGQLAGELGRRHQLVQELGESQTKRGRVIRYRFRHSLFQEFIYNRLSLGERRLLHRDVAEVMEELYQEQPEEMAVQLAHHFYQAGDKKRAFKYSHLAACRSARLFAYNETVKHITRAIEMAAEISASKVMLINLYRDRGLAYETLGKFHQAVIDLGMSAQIAHAENENHLECFILIDLGKLWASRDYNQSYYFYGEALNLAREIGDPAILASNLNSIGNWYANAEKSKEAIAYHHEALEIIKESGNQQELAKTLDLLGIASLLGADSLSSKEYFDQAIQIFRELDDRASLASSLAGRGNIGGVGYVTSTIAHPIKPWEARRDFEEAIQIAQKISSPATEAWADWSMGFVDIVQGKFGNALEIIQHGLHIATDINHRECMVGNHNALGMLFLELFAVDEAQQHIEQTIQLADDLYSQHWIHQATGALTEVYLLRSDFHEAQNTIGKVISPQTPMDTILKRYCWFQRAQLALAQDDPVLALEITDRLISTAPGLPPGQVITLLWKFKSEALTVLGQYELARSLLCKAKENAQENGEQFQLWRIHTSLAKLYKSMNCTTSFEKELSLAWSMIKELSATLKEEKLKQIYLTYTSRMLNSL
jgi:adenylate cyclase